MMHKWTAAEVPSQRGRVAVVTGANTGIGFEAASVLAVCGASVVLAVRDIDKGKHAAARIAAATPGAVLTVQELDLASLESVRAAAADLRAAHPRIDLVINNAGVMRTPKRTTRDGFELQFGTNHLGHFALTGLLLDHLLPVAGSRLVTISSPLHARGQINFDDLHSPRSYNGAAAYSRSKLANLLFTYELHRRLTASQAHTAAVAAHPGAARTELIRNLPAYARPIAAAVVRLTGQSAAMGALPALRAATDPDVRGGQYYGPDGPRGYRGHPTLATSSERSHDTALQRRLWAVSEELTGVAFPV